ncbi:LADA_0F14884g1_1 [Lachancea dasiensis]|uniref:LADA_0F14884g1_1 n=1 Tax=Lachancea dasiensis TaxID=1072105 RepID=A0A1G4JNB5_9SACH|nr:LADA_0F14884g1_1 [Lachancea dasiensis]
MQRYNWLASRHLAARFYATPRGVKVPLSAKINALISKTSAEQIYSYKPTLFVKVGSWTLAGVFAVYGVSFADWSLSSSLDLYEQEAEQSTLSEAWWKHPKLLLVARTAGSVLLSIIPFTLSALAIYAPSRIVTGVTYMPHGAFQLTRRALVSGRPVTRTAVFGAIVRNEKTRVYTGVGSQGTEDRASFAFLLTDTDKPTWDRFYIVNRSGKFWAQDGRIFDVLFGGDSAESLERSPESASVTTAKDPNLLQNLIKEQQIRTKFNNRPADARNIVLKRRSN